MISVLFQGYVVTINLVKRLTSDTLLQRLKQLGHKHPDHSRAMSKLTPSWEWENSAKEIVPKMCMFDLIQTPYYICLMLRDMAFQVSSVSVKKFISQNLINTQTAVIKVCSVSTPLVRQCDKYIYLWIQHFENASGTLSFDITIVWMTGTSSLHTAGGKLNM